MRKDKALLKFLSNPVVIKRHYSPRISRKIPESMPTGVGRWLNEWTVVMVVSGIFLYLILMVSLQVNGQIIELGKKQAKKAGVVQEMQYWEKITKEYPNYRDGYFRLALLEYQLGDSDKALSMVNKALLLDPRFEAGKAFREKLQSE